MDNQSNKLSLSTYGLILVCFFLPFVTVSCQGHEVVTLSGVQLVTGSTVESPDFFGKGKSERIPAEPVAVFTLLCAIAGLAASSMKGRTGIGAAATTAIVGLILLLLLKARFDSSLLEKGGGMFVLNYRAGFWLMLLLFICAAGINLYALRGGGRRISVNWPATSTKFCGECGARIPSRDGFCGECGTKLT